MQDPRLGDGSAHCPCMSLNNPEDSAAGHWLPPAADTEVGLSFLLLLLFLKVGVGGRGALGRGQNEPAKSFWKLEGRTQEHPLHSLGGSCRGAGPEHGPWRECGWSQAPWKHLGDSGAGVRVATLPPTR